ncbi:exported hypothetical protein [Nitrospira lenta]|uniref:Uncharacterized protein n=1 Tax=Nitrospira lenta TaxID=1436998 RepID=A0A330L7L9_9BACT|nr:exported hypothetical protein [Nitrospira lenta]
MQERRLILFRLVALFVLVLIRVLFAIAVLSSSPSIVTAMLAVLTSRFIGPIQSMLLAVTVALALAFPLPFSLALMIIAHLMLLALLFPLHRRSGSRCRGRSWSGCLRCRSGCSGFRSWRGNLSKRLGKGKQYGRSSHRRDGSNHSILHA